MQHKHSRGLVTTDFILLEMRYLGVNMAVKFHLISGIFLIREWVCSWVGSWGIVKSKATEISFEPNTLELRYIF